MPIVVRQEPPASLVDYARVSIAFEARRVLDVTPATGGRTPFVLTERDVEPYVKDYDAERDGSPLNWPVQFDLTCWGLFLARDAGRAVGAAACVFASPDVAMLRGQPDVALLWDIRVVPEARGRGVGRSLLDCVERWGVERGARWLEVETQNINVAACRFYERNGFELRDVKPSAYRDLPDEVQLLWYKRLPDRLMVRRSSRSA